MVTKFEAIVTAQERVDRMSFARITVQMVLLESHVEKYRLALIGAGSSEAEVADIMDDIMALPGKFKRDFFVRPDGDLRYDNILGRYYLFVVNGHQCSFDDFNRLNIENICRFERDDSAEIYIVERDRYRIKD